VRRGELPCAACLRRAWLLARLSAHIDLAWTARRPLPALLALADEPLIAALAGPGLEGERVAHAWERHDAAATRAVCAEHGVAALCQCDPRYPGVLRDLPDPPAALFVLGELDRLIEALAQDGVAIVGARRGSPYGLEQARALGRGLAAAGLTVVSGMALGIDAAAHAGALEAGGGATVAVLACAPEQPYPASKRELHRRIAASGAVVAELPPGTPARRWCFPARNRLIAALTRATVVVEAGERSGSLITATLAAELGREVAAVPGMVSAPLAAGTNALIADGARLVRGPHDVLELLFGATAAAASAPATPAPSLPADLGELLARVAGGRDTVAALTAAGLGVDAALAGLAQLELRGLVRRSAGGRYVPVAPR